MILQDSVERVQSIALCKSEGLYSWRYLKLKYYSCPIQGRQENSEVPGQNRKTTPLRAKREGNFLSREINFGKLLLVHFMRPPDLEALGVMRLEALGQFAPFPLLAALVRLVQYFSKGVLK